ncbi:MAG: glycosyltransferase family 2 protein [Candidatus Sumerlaeia bacterium]|nr:glycosyltransferase family 2 protein [Candidatus Sumerlaeia bacterium]
MVSLSPHGSKGEVPPAGSNPPPVHKAMTSASPNQPTISIIVPNWNGERWLGRCLSSLQIASRAAGVPCELIVVDDASSDGSCDLVRSQFPKARLLTLAKNVGFARAVNLGARKATGKYLLLANNDLSARQDFIENLYGAFREDPSGNLFAVSAKTVGWYDGKPNQLCMGAVWRGGRITPAWSDPDDRSPCLFVQAGAALYDRRRFLQLGGLCPLFEPGYWEDYDLSWRAARMGWSQKYEPAALALHIGGGSMTRRYGPDGVARMKSRNHLLFEIRNLRSPRLLMEWGARLPLTLSRDFTKYREPSSLTSGLGAAFPRLHKAISGRMFISGSLTDEELLAPWKDFRPSF